MIVTEGFGMAKPRNEKAFALIALSKKLFFFYELLFIRFMSVFCNKNTDIFKCCCNFVNNIRL